MPSHNHDAAALVVRRLRLRGPADDGPLADTDSRRCPACDAALREALRLESALLEFVAPVPPSHFARARLRRDLDRLIDPRPNKR